MVPHSLRLFFWDEAAQQYALVHGSQPSRSEAYVYGAVTRPGRYAVIGVSGDPLVLAAARTICAAGSIGAALPDAARRLIEPICTVILCTPDLRNALEQDRAALEKLLEAGAEMGLPSLGGGFGPWLGGGQDLCAECLGTRGLRLPECAIIDTPGGLSVGSPDAWISVGPKDLPGCIKQVLIDPTDSDRLYCAAMNGGAWVLERVSDYPDIGWRPLTDQLDSLRMNALAVAPSDGDVIYAASPWVSVFRSGDRGENWDRLTATLRWKAHKLLVHPADAETVYAATEIGLYISGDGGDSWIRLHDGDVMDAALDPQDSVDHLHCGAIGRRAQVAVVRLRSVAHCA